MNEKYTLKVIQHGKTQQVRVLQNGAGMAGQAVVVQATDAVRLQLVNTVTLVSPERLQLKRVGNALHLALPGGDLDAPDLVVQDYFKVSGASLQGAAMSGEWMTYDTSSFAAQSVAPTEGAADVAQSAVSAPSTVSLGGQGVWGSFAEHPWLWAGGLGVAAAAGGGGGGGSAAAADTTPLAVVQAYANGGTTTAPTAAQYTTIGVALPTVTGLSAANVLAAMNALVATKASADVGSLAQLQSLADGLGAAYAKILAEANGADPDATPGVDPTVADYAAVGVVVSATGQTLALLNSALGEKLAKDVASVDQLKAMATAAANLIGVAAGTAGATLSSADLLVLGLKINGASSGITAAQAAEFKANLANLQTSLGLSQPLASGDAVNTLAKVQSLFSLQVMRSFNDDPAAISSKTQPAPGLVDYTNLGIKSFASLTDTADTSRVDLVGTNFSAVTGFSLQTTLNSALDRLKNGVALIKADVQSMVDAYYRIIKQADGDAKVAPTIVLTAVDYTSVGVTKADGTALTDAATATQNTKVLALLNDAVGRVDATKVDTVAELSALEKAAENVVAYAAGNSASSGYGTVSYATDADWVAGLTALGVTGVTASNVAGVKAQLAAVSSTPATAVDGVDTVAEVQTLVSLARMSAFNNDPAALGSKAADVPTLADWGAVVKANTSLADATQINLDTATYWKTTNPVNGLNALNSALDAYTATTSMSKTDLQAIANAYGRVLQEADGSRTTNTDVSQVGSATGAADLTSADLVALKVTFVNASGTSLLASEQNLLLDAIGGLASTAVDTVAELNDLDKAASNVVKYAAADSAVRATVVYTDAEWVSALTSLGISGVNTSNISAIKTAIVSTNTDTDTTNNNGAGVDSYNELQSLVSLVRVNDYAKLNTGYTLPTIEDYQALLAANSSTASDAKSSNLGAYNDAVNWKLSDAFTGAEVKDMVLSYNKILTASNGTLPDPATSTILKTDYEKVGVSAGLTTLDTPEWLALLNDVVANKTTTQVDQVSELNALASVIVKVKGLEEKTFTGIETDVQKDAIYDAVTGGRLSVDDLTLLGLNTSLLSSSTVGLTLANKRLETVYDGIIAINHLNDSGVITSVSRATLDTLAEMQTLINNTSGTSVISA